MRSVYLHLSTVSILARLSVVIRANFVKMHVDTSIQILK
jgi:hypothetical protein